MVSPGVLSELEPMQKNGKKTSTRGMLIASLPAERTARHRGRTQ